MRGHTQWEAPSADPQGPGSGSEAGTCYSHADHQKHMAMGTKSGLSLAAAGEKLWGNLGRLRKREWKGLVVRFGSVLGDLGEVKSKDLFCI